MPLEPISEQEDIKTSSSCFCCPPASLPQKDAESRSVPVVETMERVVPDRNKASGRARPGMSRHQSVYISAREVLGEKELAALKEFEDAAMAIGGDESLYFDALDAADAFVEDNSSQTLTYAPARVADPRSRQSVTFEDPPSLLGVMDELKEPRVRVECPGYPGQLTEKELAACQKFRDELNKRKNDIANNGRTYEDVVRVYDPVETEPYALCRFVRARQFEVDKVFDMITEILDVWRDAQKHNYFPDPNAALGAPVNVFLTQMPSIYSGCAKNGSPVAYARAEGLSVEGMECLTDLDNIERYAWYATLHKFKNQIARAQKINPDVVRCETIQVVDLAGLNANTLNKRTLGALQKLIAVNKCFPEVLNSMVIINAPRFFTFFWRVIKAMLDPRTASKVAMFSNERDGIKWMQERIDKKELLSDYGGEGDTFDTALSKQNIESSATRQIVKRFDITTRSSDKVEFVLEDNERAQFNAYTRSTAGAEFEVFKGATLLTKVDVKGLPESKPYSTDLCTDLFGPGKFTISSKGRSVSLDHFVIAGEIFEKD